VKRLRQNAGRTALLVVTDADNEAGPDERRRLLRQALQEDNLQVSGPWRPNRSHHPVWEIENWIRYLLCQG